MKQLVQSVKSGALRLVDVPAPVPRRPGGQSRHHAHASLGHTLRNNASRFRHRRDNSMMISWRSLALNIGLDALNIAISMTTHIGVQ